MLYLAEVKKQNRGFIGGNKTELKLLACQHNDQTWSAVPGEETILYEGTNSLGEGALLLVTLGNNRQIQGTPELAGIELVRQLQKISRLMERSKDEQEKIEQWKQSLTYQSQELTRREMEIESQLEQIEQMESEFEYLERQRQELDSSWKRLQAEQKQLEEGQHKFGPSADLTPEQATFIQSLITRLTGASNGNGTFLEPLKLTQTSIDRQQKTLDTYWQTLKTHKDLLGQRQREFEQSSESLTLRKQELQNAKTSIEQVKIQLQVQENVLGNKQEMVGRVKLNLQTLEELRDNITRLARGEDIETEQKIDVDMLENLPLGELKEIVNNLQKELDKLVNFVNDQEEELTFQCQTVEELQAKLATASDYERLTLEEELTEEQERKGMLDRTLMGQRRNLRDRQGVLMEYARVLKRRKGIFESEPNNKINFEPLLLQLAEQQHNNEEERQRLEQEIEHLQQSLRQVKEMLNCQGTEQEIKAKAIDGQERQWQQAHLDLVQLRSQIQLYEALLQPLQNQVDEMRQKLEEFAQWFKPASVNGSEHPFNVSA